MAAYPRELSNVWIDKDQSQRWNSTSETQQGDALCVDRGELASGATGSYCIALTFHQLVQARNLLEPINGVDCSHSLGQIHVIRQSSGQIS